jgi:hypothetical protein
MHVPLLPIAEIAYKRHQKPGDLPVAQAHTEVQVPQWKMLEPDEPATRSGLAVVMLTAVAVRLWVVATQTYVVFPDETFQYLEPAHRLLFGSGVITWEFLDGIRSWFLPAILAAVIWLVSLISPHPEAYVGVLRTMCVLASLSVPFVGYRLTARRFGPQPALLTGLLCAFAPDLVYFAPVIMTEPLATYAALLAIWLGDGTSEQSPTGRRLLAAGLLFGLAISLRYQYAPVLGGVAMLQHARRPRNLAIVAAACMAVVVPVLGVLDALTWGAPFQSVWLNYHRNATQGVSDAMGTQAWFYYAAYPVVAWGALAPALLACAVLGGVRVPVLGAVVLCTIAMHSFIPHKELRFIFLSTACLPVLVGVGLVGLLRRLPRWSHDAQGAMAAGGIALVISGYTAVSYRNVTPADAWHRDRSILQAVAAARMFPEACGLAIRSVWLYRTGGYTYWHRDVPIYFETWDDAQKIDHATFTVRLENRLHGRLVSQYSAVYLPANAGRFNILIGKRDDPLSGFSEQSCHGNGSTDDPELCVFTRAGSCD